MLDDLVELNGAAKLSKDQKIKIAYQIPIDVKLDEDADEPNKVVPYTFEDALAYENISLFKTLDGTGLISKFKEAMELNNIEDCSQKLFDDLRKGEKAKLALDLLFLKDPSELNIPSYIKEGLIWLEAQLSSENLLTVIVKLDSIKNE
ncbi:MAG: hypothetical protein WDZ80_07780 [Candidatus Paceibacterota bacterium]